jgi:hypothetical protein
VRRYFDILILTIKRHIYLKLRFILHKIAHFYEIYDFIT